MMIQEKLKEWNRVIKLSRKPKRNEFVMIAKITGLGMVVIGTIGFIIRMLLQITGITL
ncbi:MAG: protein translocase SEC61 complex subunit gamma [Candidatus Hydrothermarchaeaceae archaeon]